MRIDKATHEDFDTIIAFYDDVTERTPEIATYALWSKGKHPTADGIRAYIEEGSMYLYKEKEEIVAAMALTMYQGEDYHAIEWSRQVNDNDVAVIHILAVSPDSQGNGIGSEMIREAIRLAQEKGMKSIRLDALASTPPLKTTELPVKDTLSLGFHRVVIEPFGIAYEAGVGKHDAGHILVGGCKEHVRVPVRPPVHALIDEMRVARPLAVSAEDAVHTGVGYMEHDFIDVCHLLWFG